jgi:ABC-type amino acid transport system permease subunit
MSANRWLAVVPFLALIVGPFFVNRATPFIADLPFLLAWIVAWILITSAIMAAIYATDPANREGEP